MSLSFCPELLFFGVLVVEVVEVFSNNLLVKLETERMTPWCYDEESIFICILVGTSSVYREGQKQLQIFSVSVV